MKKNLAKGVINDLLRSTDITINGHALWDPQIYNEQFYARVLHNTDLGLGESYMEGWWDCKRLDMLIARLIEANLENKLKLSPRFVLKLFLSKIFNLQTKRRSLQVGREHYDLGNDLFQVMLDSRMNYSCGYW